MCTKPTMRAALSLAGAVALSLALLASRALADHCPESVVAAGAPEARLAGITFEPGEFSSVRRLLGEPADARFFATEGGPPGSGEARYSWQLGAAELAVFTAYRTTGQQRVETVAAVHLRGRSGRRSLRTGRGLRLGQDRARVEALYGTTSMAGSLNGPKLPGRSITYCFADETELSVGFSAEGRVVALWLAPSAE